MPQDARSVVAAIGFRVKSGWATAVLLAGPIQGPHVLDRRAIDLSDPAVPESRQPYHARMGMLETDEGKLARRRMIVTAATRQSVRDLLRDYRKGGHTVRAVGLVVGSMIEPARITNPHIRAHALEGRLFRTVLEAAVCSCRLSCSVVVERDLYARAADVLGRSQDELKRLVTNVGRPPGGPWRADEKTACLAAWLALA